MVKRHDSFFFLIAFLVFIVDQFTKSIIKSLEAPLKVTDFLALVYIKNSGTALGLFPGSAAFVAILSLFVVLGILAYYGELPNKKYVLLGAGFLLGGTVGNLWDRVVLGHVVDFIAFSFWPTTFNVADVALTIGTGLLLFYFLRKK